MGYIELAILGELNDFLGSNGEKTRLSLPLCRRTSIKDLLEALGPPHPEVGQLEVNGEQVDFSYRPRPGDHIRVGPQQRPVDVLSSDPLHPSPLSGERFVVDVNVGRLARKLRLLGFDAAYRHDWDDDTIAELAASQGRIVLTKDIALLKRKIIVWGRYLRAKDPEGQLLEVLDYFGLNGPYDLLSRCLDCNVQLEPVSKEAVLHRLEPGTRRHFNTFSMCPSCHKIYWAGSHQERIMQWLREQGLEGG